MVPRLKYPEFPCEPCCWAAWERFCKTRNPRKHNFNLPLPASEVDADPLPSDIVWLSLCRLILLYKDDRNGPDRYQISGIAYVPGAKRDNEFIVVPKDSKRANIGAPEPITSQFLRVNPIAHPFDDWTVRPGDTGGYILHSSCWTVIEKRLGGKGTVRLDLLIKTLQRRWDEVVLFFLRDDVEFEQRKYEDLRYEGANDDYKRLIRESSKAGDYPWPRADQVHIYELPMILRKSYESHRKLRMIRPRRQVNLLSTKYSLPLEILYLITDHLHANELRHMAIAFNEQFPVSFWRRQIPDTFFEVNRIERINWSLFAVLVRADHIQKSPGVLNRRRLLDMIRPRQEDENVQIVMNRQAWA